MKIIITKKELSILVKRIKARIIIEKKKNCWVYQGGGHDMHGHKRIHLGSRHTTLKTFYVHRIMYLRKHGQLIEGLVVRHLCGNPSCCNPLHLKEGTQEENMQDWIKHSNGVSIEQ